MCGTDVSEESLINYIINRLGSENHNLSNDFRRCLLPRMVLHSFPREINSIATTKDNYRGKGIWGKDKVGLFGPIHGRFLKRYIKQPPASTETNIICQLCDKPSHSVWKCKQCTNFAYSTNNGEVDNEWVIDFGAIHHMNPSTSHFVEYSTYEGNEQIIIGDGSPLHITHIGSNAWRISYG